MRFNRQISNTEYVRVLEGRIKEVKGFIRQYKNAKYLSPKDQEEKELLALRLLENEQELKRVVAS